MARLLLIVGTRPQIVKSAPVVHEAERHDDIELQLVHTGQHYDYEMSKIFFDEHDLPVPKANLEVGSGSHAYQTAQIMTKLEPILSDCGPDCVLIPGDTNSALAAALTSIKLRFRIAHIEAGARSYDMFMVEEINRRIIDHISSLLFAASKNCKLNLERESVLGDIYVTGDTMYDAYVQHLPRAKRSNILDKLDLDDKEYDVLTLHRAENVDDKNTFLNIIELISKSDLKTVFPIHPRSRRRMEELGIRLGNSNPILIDPVGYHDMIKLLLHARLVLTDSGGLQKEAFWSGVPCITLRDRTEWIETVELGVNFLAGSERNKIIEIIDYVVKSYDNLLAKIKEFNNPYGSGDASKQIINILRTQSLSKP
nr:UDP-N-acetylglucosamine 2-epimerase (non-hydrolyzing) [Candidatus Njordarchaeota archaeon]